MKLNEECGKAYKAFGIGREKGLAIYNRIAEIIENYEQFRCGNICVYINHVLDICETEGERMYACYQFGNMFFGRSAQSWTPGLIRMYRAEFGVNTPEITDLRGYEDGYEELN